MATAEEVPWRIDPCFLTEASGELLDLISELPAAATALPGRLHPKTAAGLAELVRVMNCYYSNLIEGHNTRPRDIERALADDLDADERRRHLQLEARQHIRVQREIDELFSTGALPEPASIDFLRFLHRAFYRDAPKAMLRIAARDGERRMAPGEFRSRDDEDVVVGRHHPPSGTRVLAFMTYFEEQYRFARLTSATRLLAMAGAHHRLSFIHPFLDGNGRVSRLMSHAMGLAAGIGAHGLWSISRGLARGLASRTEYKSLMDYADTPRQGDLDGRGNLSQRALAEFTTWFLKVALDQVRFMSELFDLARLGARLGRYAEEQGWRPESVGLLIEVLHRGEIARGDAAVITGLRERTSRALLSTLLADGILGSETPKGPVSLRFPASALDRLFPRLFPES
jgi:Fic family protein